MITQFSKRKDYTYNESAPSAGSLNRLFFPFFFFSKKKEKGGWGCEKMSLTWRPAPTARPLGQPGEKNKTGGGENLQISLAELGGGIKKEELKKKKEQKKNSLDLTQIRSKLIREDFIFSSECLEFTPCSSGACPIFEQ